jgi:hypothetical protein
MPIDIALVREKCAVHPNYLIERAYGRTQICCAVMIMLGYPIPNWKVIKDVITKGSASDINRGIRDFRAEHVRAVKRPTNVTLDDLKMFPEEFSTIWSLALLVARAEFELQSPENEKSLRDQIADLSLRNKALEESNQKLVQALKETEESCSATLAHAEAEHSKAVHEINTLREQGIRERHILGLAISKLSESSIETRAKLDRAEKKLNALSKKS